MKFEMNIEKARHKRYLMYKSHGMNLLRSETERLFAAVDTIDLYLEEKSETLKGIDAVKVRNLAAVIVHLRETSLKKDKEAADQIYCGVRAMSFEECEKVRNDIVRILGWHVACICDEVLRFLFKPIKCLHFSE